MYIYFVQPLPGSWNDSFYYASILVAAWVAAILAILVWRQYRVNEPARQVAGFFALGILAFALGEAAWVILRPFYEEFPDVFWTDLFWIMAYVACGISLFLQYRLIYWPSPKVQRRIILLICLGVPLLLALFTYLLRQAGVGQEWSWQGMLVFAFYPLADVLVGGAGLVMARLFGRGLWGRAWWGIVAFAVYDSVSFWYYMGGEQILSPQVEPWLNLFVDTLYLAAYLLMALACLGQLWLHRSALQSQETSHSRVPVSLGSDISS
jgi:hypothetical protein